MTVIQNYLLPKGRIGRGSLILRHVVFTLTWVLWYFSCAITLARVTKAESVLYICLAITLVPYIYVTAVNFIKRLHDFNAPGWFLPLFVLIAPLNLLFIILPGTNGDNRFGPKP